MAASQQGHRRDENEAEGHFQLPEGFRHLSLVRVI